MSARVIFTGQCCSVFKPKQYYETTAEDLTFNNRLKRLALVGTPDDDYHPLDIFTIPSSVSHLLVSSELFWLDQGHIEIPESIQHLYLTSHPTQAVLTLEVNPNTVVYQEDPDGMRIYRASHVWSYDKLGELQFGDKRIRTGLMPYD